MRRKSERGCQPWGRHPRSIWLTVLTPANHGAEGFTNRPVEKHNTLRTLCRPPAGGFIRPDVVPSNHPTPASRGQGDHSSPASAAHVTAVLAKLSMMNERRQAHIDFYLERLEYWRSYRPHHSTARLLAARDADEAYPLRM